MTRYKKFVGSAGQSDSLFHKNDVIESLTRAISSPDSIHTVHDVGEVLKNINNQEAKVLVVGIGSGNLIRFLSKAFPQVLLYATDISPEPEQRLRLNPGGSNVYVNESTSTAVYPADMFDIVVLPTGIMRYLSEADCGGIIQELTRLVRSQGFFVGSEFEHANMFADFVDLLKKHGWDCHVSERMIDGVFRNSLYYIAYSFYYRSSIWKKWVDYTASWGSVDYIDVIIKSAGYRSGLHLLVTAVNKN